MKKIIKSKFLMKAGGSILASYIRLVYNTSEKVFEPENFKEELLKYEPLIFAMWHGQFLMIPMLKPKDTYVRAMVARHSDAELIGQALLKFNVELVRGAGAGARKKDRGGATALRQSLTSLAEDKISIAMTADVPPGPARKTGEGIIRMARLSGRPIIPAAIASSRYKALNTWSRFTINLPFSKLAFVAGEPIYVAEDADEEECERVRQLVEDAMNDVTKRAYKKAGADPMNATPSSMITNNTQLPRGFALKSYELVTSMASPLVPYFLSKRAKRGKEVLTRKNERIGQPTIKRPEGKLIWFHAASVGETNAILPLMHQLKKQRPDLSQLLTTGTVTSAQLAAQRIPENSIHQYVPVDVPRFVKGFMEHWQPDIVFFTESEIWPNLVMEASARKIPLILLNGIMSNKSFRRWKKRPTMARTLFSRYSLVLDQNSMMKKGFVRLGARGAHIIGNLKMDAPLLPVNLSEFEKLKVAINDRPVFLAASTHPGEEEIIANAHKMLSENIPDLLTIIAPRHPERGAHIRETLQEMGLKVPMRSMGDVPDKESDIYLANTIGELGIFYSLSSLAFMGGSLIDHGGQNPIEAIKMGTSVLTGPNWKNFNDSYKELFKLNGAREIISAETMAAVVEELLGDPDRLQSMNLKAQEAVANLSGALDRTMEVITPYLPPLPENAGDSSRLRCVS